MRTENFRKWPLDMCPSWRACWIAPAGAVEMKNVSFRARCKWRLDNVPSLSILHVAAESRYRLYVNGIEVGCGPVRGTRTVMFFDSYEVTGLLTPGDNWIAVEAQSPNVPTFKAAPSQPGVLVQLDDGGIIATDGSWDVQIASSWRQDVSLYTFQIGYMEWHDLSLEPLHWKVGGDASEWVKACVLSVDESLDGRKLLARDIPGLREERHGPTGIPIVSFVPKLEDTRCSLVAKRMSEEPHISIKGDESLFHLLMAGDQPAVLYPTRDGSGVAIVFVFGQEINGGIELDIEGEEGVIVDIAYDECLRDDRLPATVSSYAFADRYTLREGRQCVRNVFSERGYSMVQVVIRNFQSPVKIFSLYAVDRTYPFIDRGTFCSSDALLNDIWSACANTLKSCSTDTFVDCPWRENAFYLNDMVVENVTSLQTFGDSRFNARCFRLAASQVRPDGLIPAPVPFGLLPGKTEVESFDTLTLPSANLFLPQMLEEYFLYSGDRKLVSDLVAIAEGILNSFSRWEDQNGLVCPPEEFWNFFDWSYELNDISLTGRNTAVFNWFYVRAIDSVIRLFGYLGDSRDLTDWAAKAHRVSQSVDRVFWDDQRALYKEWIVDEESEETHKVVSSQLSHAAALLSGRYPEERFEVLREAFLRKDILAPELFMQHYVLRALVEAGKPREALELIRRLWGRIVLSGSTTIWECGVHQHGKSAYSGAGSVCHGFSTAPIDFLQGTVLGVRPIAPGFARCKVAPNSLGLAYAKGTVPTPRGNLEIEWSLNGAKIALRMRIPPGVRAELPDGRCYGEGLHRVEYSVEKNDEMAANSVTGRAVDQRVSPA